MKFKRGIPTMDQFSGGRISQTAAQYWSRDNPKLSAFDSEIIEKIYTHEILGSNFSIRQVMILEFSQYLENYLWPNFDAAKCSTRHLLSIVIMVNEKFRERVPAWEHFVALPEQFPAFFRKVCELILDDQLTSLREQALLIKFINHCFSSVEVQLIREQIQKYVSLPIWECLLPAKRDAIFKASSKLGRYWKALKKSDAKRTSEELTQLSVERRFLHNLIQKFLRILSTIPVEGIIDRWKLLFCERFMELMIDLESLPPTRRFFNAVLHGSHVITYARMSYLAKRSEEGHLFRQLLDMLIFYSKFEINDLTGEPLSEDDMTDIHYDRISNLQKAAFKYFKDELKEFYLLNVASVDRRSDLMNYFASLSKERLYQVTEFLHLMPPRTDVDDLQFAELSDKFLLELLVSTHERQSSQLDALNEMPLYPTEKIIWDENVVPNEFYSGEGTLALNKLNLQFLTLHDYLLRNFNLFRLESTYEVRGDLEDAIFRMKPWLHEDKSRVIFGGWARMALPINTFSIVEVSKPNIGEKSPASVKAEVSLTLNLRQEVKTEWENLRKHDVCLLIGVKPVSPFGTKYDLSKKFLDQITVTHVRGCEIEGMLDAEGNTIEEWVDPKPEQQGDTRTWRIKLDSNQYRLDLENVVNGGEDVYGSFNIMMRRRPKENNFKAVLETIRQLMNTHCVVPDWLEDLILGYGDPAAAHYTNMKTSIASLDFFDTFLSLDHAKESFPGYEVVPSVDAIEQLVPPFKLEFTDLAEKNEKSDAGGDEKMDTSEKEPAASGSKVMVTPYVIPSRGPYLYNKPRQNGIRFTPVQTEAVKSGMQPGLTMVVGPPGTGKTDVAVQIISNIYHNWPEQRTLIVTHSNQALNQLFEKCMALDIDERHLLRLGHGEEALETEKDFSRYGRVNYVLKQRLRLLKEVHRLQCSVGVAGDVSYTCETAGHFYLYQVLARWEKFLSHTKLKKGEKCCADIAEHFPFFDYFANAPQPLFKGGSFEEDMEIAEGCWRHLRNIFKQLDEFRAFELLRSGRDRTEYLLVKEAKVIAMTCTHAALRRRDMVQLGFKFDNILMEEAAQILEIETFIPLLLQDPLDGHNRLKRWIMIGDHHQLPPVIKNLAFQKFSNMEQSLFARFVRLGVKTVQLDAQGRARASIAELYNWRYKTLGNLSHVVTGLEYRLCNPGFVFDYQVIDVANFNGVGESTPTPYFYQNLAEAEYAVAIFMYMRLLGYPAEKITILTTYNGQKFLIRDVVNKRCATNPLIGEPHKIATVDKYQGQQNDYIILSLVRTQSVGHVRDVRRLIVALSRARLGLYILARTSLFRNCFELRPAFNILLQRPQKLMVQPVEKWPPTRLLEEKAPKPPVEIQDMTHMAQFVYDFYNVHCVELQANIAHAALLQEQHETEMKEAAAAPQLYKEGGEVDPVPKSVTTEVVGKVDGKAAERDIEFEVLVE